MRRIVYLQAGGPTAVINQSFVGVRERCNEEGSKLLISPYGLKGLIEGELRTLKNDDLSEMTDEPGAHCGSSRTSLENREDLLDRCVGTIRKQKINAVLLNGGNDTMKSAYLLSKRVEKEMLNCNVIGIPKTIDNDLLITDRCPGFLSAANFVARSVRYIIQDDYSYEKGRINIFEIMGRDSGFLTAASCLFTDKKYKLDYIYVPEVPFDLEDMTRRAIETFEKTGHCNIAVSEGIRDKEGILVSAMKEKDSFGNIQMGGVASYLSSKFKERGYRSRGIEFSLLQRCFPLLSCNLDIRDARECGRAAVKSSIDHSGYMVAIKEDGIDFKYELASLNKVYKGVKKLPLKYIDTENKNIRNNYRNKLLPFFI